MQQQRRFMENDERTTLTCQTSRRSWLAGVIWGLAGASAAPRLASAQQTEQATGEAEEIALVQATAKKAGLEPFARSQKEHFLALGDADVRFRDAALEICESLATAFLAHFRQKGFKLAMPARRLTVITLKDAASYRAYLGEDPGATVAGHYDLDTNRLVMFDFRPEGQAEAVVANPERVNLLALVHETAHLLCFNTGLLSRQAAVPDWVSEGLGTYVEMWQRRNKQAQIGAINQPRLLYLRQSIRAGTPLIAAGNLFADDELLRNAETEQLAYAESWLLVHWLMKPPRLEQFKSYLAGLPAPAAVSKRVEYAEKHLGPLKALDRELERDLKRLSR